MAAYRNQIFKEKTTKPASANIFCTGLFLGCFFIGILLAITFLRHEAAWIAYLQENAMLRATPEMEGNLRRVCFSRIPIWMVFILFARSMIGKIISLLFASWEGFMLGFLLTAFFMRHGILGILVMFGLCFPQIIFYFFAFLGMYRQILFPQNREENYLSKSRFRRLISAYSFLLLVGVLIESYVNYFLLLKIRDFFLGI